jgi:quercetin dioxygenase-like cupin family protein
MITRRRMLAATGGLAALAAADPQIFCAGLAFAETPMLSVSTKRRMEQWKSNEAVRSRPARDRRTISPARSARTRCSRQPDPARVTDYSVSFEPGARTAWHTHPLGQTLIVTSGCGWAQRQGGPIEEIQPGDVVWFQPGEKQ